MGLYDMFGKQMIQLKVGNCGSNCYKVGDRVKNVSDGVYVGYEGVVVILKHKVVATFTYLMEKWGGHIDLHKLMDEYTPMAKVVEDVRKEHEKDTDKHWEDKGEKKLDAKLKRGKK